MLELDELNQLLTDDLGGTYQLCSPATSGRNNRVFVVEGPSDRFFLKQFYQAGQGCHDRYSSESEFIQHCESLSIESIPALTKAWHEHKILLYRFEKGSRPNTVDEEAVAQAARFVRHLSAAKRDSFVSERFAAEACDSIFEHLVIIQQRIEKLGTRLASRRLSDKQMKHEIVEALSAFIQGALKAAFDQQWRLAHSTMRNVYTQELPESEWILSPSDFGFHNSLYDPETGRYTFLDFEYAGWDDPAKLLVDFFLQPQVPVDANYLREFIKRAFASRNGQVLIERARVLAPVLRLKWCCILLNGVLNEGESRRRFAGADENLLEQLSLAKQVFEDKQLEQALDAYDYH